MHLSLPSQYKRKYCPRVVFPACELCQPYRNAQAGSIQVPPDPSPVCQARPSTSAVLLRRPHWLPTGFPLGPSPGWPWRELATSRTSSSSPALSQAWDTLLGCRVWGCLNGFFRESLCLHKTVGAEWKRVKLARSRLV